MFSVLLPSRNRLEFLKVAIETVRRQDYPDWEVIISDNDSKQDIAGYARSLGDPRIKYFRTDRFVPVTENWNNALRRSRGEYLIMLGDDDGLLQGYFSTALRLIQEHGNPDAIYTSAYVYAYPGVMPSHPDGYLQPYAYDLFIRSAGRPFWLDRREAIGLVRQSMDLKMPFGYNMQFSLVSRQFVDSLSANGPFFQSPFPDYYATNVMFLKASRILVYPEPLVVIGISPKSYGFYFFNRREQEGVEFLSSLASDGRRSDRPLLPGPNMNTSWLLAMETIIAHYGADFGLRVNYLRYRRLQILNTVRDYYVDRRISVDDFAAFKKRLSTSERLILLGGAMVFFNSLKVIPRRGRELLVGRLRRAVASMTRQAPPWKPVSEQRYRDLLDVFERVAPQPARAPSTSAGDRVAT